MSATIEAAPRSLTGHFLHSCDLAHGMLLELAEDLDDTTARLAPACAPSWPG
jgi:hypothetical protein